MTTDERARSIADRLTSWTTDEDVAMIAEAIREARAEALEEAAGVAVSTNTPFGESPAKVIATRILALKDTTNGE